MSSTGYLMGSIGGVAPLEEKDQKQKQAPG
jgi:hypothetical protein